MPFPKRGEIWMADLGLAAKIRPVLVMNIEFTDVDYALYSVIPHTTSPRNSQFEVSLPVHSLKKGVFNIQGLMAVPKTKLNRKLSSLNSDQLYAIETILMRWLGIETKI